MENAKKLFLSSCVLAAMLLASCGERPPMGGNSSAGGGGGGGGEDSSQGGGSTPAEEAYEDTDYHGKIRIYYHNDAANYANKRIWAWMKGVDGKEYTFDNQTSPDAYGVYADFDLSQGIWKDAISTSFSFIIKEAGTWAGQSTDTICPFGRFLQNESEGMITVYACEGEGGNIDTFIRREEALGDRISAAYFTSWNKLHVEGSGQADSRAKEDVGRVDSYELYAYDDEYEAADMETKMATKSKYLIASGTPKLNSFDVDLTEDIVPYKSYSLEAFMSSDTSRRKSKIASFTRLFDTPEFVTKYTYSGHDLGLTTNEDGDGTFKLWAPTSSRVQVKIYSSGVPGDLRSTFSPTANWGKLYDMEYTDHGVWQATIDDYDFNDVEYPNFYTYIVTNSAGTNETIDPYATSAGINGIRGGAFPLDKVAFPDNWEHIKSGDLLTDISRPNELSVYEAHIRDLTADATWNGTKRPGTYEAFIEEGTTYAGKTFDNQDVTVKTGFDHIKEMGVKAIQLLPVFDFDNDERWFKENGDLVTDIEDYGQEKVAPAYNWGYNPLNYNVVEGSYSSNPFDAVARIKEFRNLVSKAAENDIRIIMDVVYNHFASINGNPLQKVVPGYYLRMMPDGSYYDGTGCGNVTASERIMFQRFCVDSVCHWACDYKIKGFRFDLMGCLTVGTMRAIKDALYEIDPDIVVYGEGWAGSGDGGFEDVVYKNYPSADSDNWSANTHNLYSKLYDMGKGAVGGFNDCFRDSLKGNTVYSDIIPAEGYLTGQVNKDTKKQLGEGILGASEWHGQNNEQSVNFAACHDNYTVFDQLNYRNSSTTAADKDNDDVLETVQAAVSANAAALLNQGIGFINGGDEFFRQKVMKPGDEMYAKMEESIIGKSAGHDWVEGDGIKMSSGNYLVRNSYQYGDDVNAFKWDRKAKYNAYYEQVKEASLMRNELMGNIFGRPYSEISSREINNVFGSTYDDPGKPLVACYLKGTDGNNYYLAFGGKSQSKWNDLSCGNCHIDVLYSSTLDHTKGQAFDITNGLLGAAKWEYLLVKSTSIA